LLHAQFYDGSYSTKTSSARFPLIEVNGEIVATSIGTLEIGGPNLTA